jgi:hypothetical protein
MPFMLIMGPPCTMFCSLVFSNWFRMPQEIRVPRLREAVMLADVAVWLATLQVDRSEYYVLENPEGSQLWTRENVTWLQSGPTCHCLLTN